MLKPTGCKRSFLAKESWPKYLTVIAVIAVFGIMLFFVNSRERFRLNPQTGQAVVSFEKAEIVDVVSQQIEPDPRIPNLVRGVQELKIEILTGECAMERHSVRNYLSARFGVFVQKGDTIIVRVDTASNGYRRITVNSPNRTPVILGAIALFAALLFWIGGKKGALALLGLGFTLCAVLFIFIPMLVQGYSPIFTSVVISILCILATLLCICGWSAKALIASLGTSVGVIIAGLLSFAFGKLARVSGFHMEESESLVIVASNTGMNVGYLLFAGILIASLGAVMDVAVSISTGVHEVRKASPSLSRQRLFQSGMNIGRDIIGTMSNTLILAFAGTSINTLILIYTYNVEFNQLMNLDAIAIEIVRGICASAALVLTVPMVSALSAWLLPGTLSSDSGKK